MDEKRTPESTSSSMEQKEYEAPYSLLSLHSSLDADLLWASWRKAQATDRRYSHRQSSEELSDSTTSSQKSHVSLQQSQQKASKYLQPRGDKQEPKRVVSVARRDVPNNVASTGHHPDASFGRAVRLQGNSFQRPILPPRSRMLFDSTSTKTSLFSHQEPPSLHAPSIIEAKPSISGLPKLILEGPSNCRLSPIDPERQFRRHHESDIFEPPNSAGAMRSPRQDRRSAPYQDRKDNTSGSSSRDLSSHSAGSSQLGPYSTPPANIPTHGSVSLTTPNTMAPQTTNERAFGVRFLPPNCPSWKIGTQNYPLPNGDVTAEPPSKQSAGPSHSTVRERKYEAGKQ
ncbi:hypothetical protein IW261DRAFT_1506159 [Armillaria novae-zelandiae]|uniref:Uncharacterized protein n=1 Tax=Armillaria novae-zelandiae TaxID=153914 RepID=A0AA39T951_9AGAR|nr:hypothetical protein IW261DRAFT_1506159 [Armillaria novae-zelandiae]